MKSLRCERFPPSKNDAIAVEDNPDGLAAAREAGTIPVALPGAFHEAGRFADAVAVLDRLDFATVRDHYRKP